MPRTAPVSGRFSGCWTEEFEKQHSEHLHEVFIRKVFWRVGGCVTKMYEVKKITTTSAALDLNCAVSSRVPKDRLLVLPTSC